MIKCDFRDHLNARIGHYNVGPLGNAHFQASALCGEED